MAIASGPGKGKKKEASKPLKATSQSGQMKAAPGYKMDLLRKKDEPSTRTKSISGSPTGTKVTTPVGIKAPVPAGQGGKAAAAPAKKKGPSAVGKAISRAKNSIELAARKRIATSAYRGGGGGGRRGGGKTCAAYR